MGLVATYVVENRMLGTPRADPAFISTLIVDVLNFATLAAAALILRSNAAAHKRLMLLAKMSLLQATFIRWWGTAMFATFGKGFLGGWMADYLGVSLLVLAIGVYDLITRRRLPPVYVLGVCWILTWRSSPSGSTSRLGGRLHRSFSWGTRFGTEAEPPMPRRNLRSATSGLP